MQVGNAFFLQSIKGPAGIIATISEQPLGFGKFVQQGSGTDVIAHLPCSMIKLIGRPFASVRE